MKIIDIGIGKIGVAESLDSLRAAEIDAALIAKPLLNEVKLDSEIAGLTSFAVSAAEISQNFDYPILCGCTTSFNSLRHISVMTFAYGRLADIADRTYNLGGGGYAEGDAIKILRLKKFDLGLLVDTDVLLAKNWHRIASRCDAIASLALGGSDSDFAYVPTLSSIFNKPYAVAFAEGEISWGTPNEEI